MTRTHRGGWSALALLLLLGCGGCSGSSGGTTEPVVPPPAALVVAQQPVGGTSGLPFATQPVVHIVTAAGGLAASASATVTVALLDPARGTLGGTTSVTATNGVASFTNLAITGTGSFALVFSAAGLTAATSQGLTVTPRLGPPASLALGSARLLLRTGQASSLATIITRDADGNILPTPALAFSTHDAKVAAVDAQGTVMAIGAGQTIVVATIGSAPAVADSALVVVASPTGTVLLTSISGFTLQHDTTVTISIFADLRNITPRLGSGRLDVVFTPAQLTFVSSAPGAGFAPAVGSLDAATGQLHLAFADPAGAGGVVEIAKLTFRAASAAGVAGRIALVASEMTATDFSDLLPGMIQVTQPLVLR
jgi:hypothetical protein